MTRTTEIIDDAFNIDALNDEVTQEELDHTEKERVRENLIVNQIQTALKITFSEEQRAIITHKGKPLNVMACAGSGKTTVLVAKMFYRELHGKVKPYNMLGITFNTKARNEIEGRYLQARRRMGLKTSSMPTFKTFHSLFLMILKTIKGYSSYGVVTEGKYMFQLMKMIKSDGSREQKEIYDEMMAYRGSLINHGYSHDGIEGATFEDVSFNQDNYKAIMTKYKELKEEDKVFDFDDMQVMLHTELIREGNDEARESFRKVFHDINIDEYQDISKVQLEIMDDLNSRVNQLVTIGDDDQSIYGFRGSDPQYIQDFVYRYPNAERLHLGDNYRCKANILEPIIASISLNTVRVDKSIRAYNPGGEVEVVPVRNSLTEIAGLIKEDTEGMYASDFDDIGVLVRLNSQRMMLADVLAESGVQVDIGNMSYSLRSNRVYKTVMGLIDAIKEEDNRKFGDYGRILVQSLHHTELQKYKNEKRKNWYQELIVDNRKGLPVYILDMVAQIKETNNMRNAIGLMWKMVSPYYKALAKKGYGSFENTTEIFRHLFKISTGLTVDQFKKSENMKESFLSLYCKSGNGLQIHTLHSVKGLEYDTVYMVGLDGRRFPNMRHVERLKEKHGAGKALEYLEEERRLFYVGWTRAKNRLVISYLFDDPSLFLSEVVGLDLPGVESRSTAIGIGDSVGDSGNGRYGDERLTEEELLSRTDSETR